MSMVKFDLNSIKIDVNKFFSKINATDTCWTWNGHIRTSGYGGMYWNRKQLYAHRVSYYIFNGTIDNDMVIDHMCNNKICVNPDHLRCIPQRLNAIQNNSSVVYDNYNKTHCKNGHEFSGSNLKMVYRKKENKEYRVCRACYNKLQLKAYHARKNKKL